MAEIYITLAYLFTHFEFFDLETNLDDLISEHDLGAPFPKADSRGLLVKLRPVTII